MHDIQKKLKLLLVFMCFPLVINASMMGQHNSAKNGGAVYVSTSHNQNIHIDADIPPNVVVPPGDISNPGDSAKYFQIKRIEFSNGAHLRKDFQHNTHRWSEFYTGVKSGWYFRERDDTARVDDHAYNGTITWDDGTWTGQTPRKSLAGYRSYSQNGWFVLSYGTAWGKFRINKRAINNKFFEEDSSGGKIKFFDTGTAICFDTYHRINSCLSYTIQWEAIPL